MEIHTKQKKWILSLALLVLVSGQAALTLLSSGYVDEVSYVNPGASWALGDGFVSNMWYAQEAGKTWAGGAPGMSFIYGVWFKLMGFGALQSKLLSLLLHVSGIGIIMTWAWRFYKMSLVSNLALGCVLLLLPSLVWAGVGCRLEVFALIFFGWFLWLSFPANGHGPRWYSCIVMGALSALIGAHFVGFYALAFGAVFLARPNLRAFKTGLLVAAGMAFSLLAIFILHKSMGTWDDFVQSRVHYMLAENTKNMSFLLHGLEIYAPTPDVLLIGIASATAFLYCAVFGYRLPGGLWPYGLSAAIYALVPAYVYQIGLFQPSYAWMVAAPIAVLMSPLIQRASEIISPKILTAAVCFCLSGYAYACASLVSVQLKTKRDFFAASAYISSHAAKMDSIIITQEVYYPIRKNFPHLFMRSRTAKLPNRTVTEIVWIINRRSSALSAAANEGGLWNEVYVSPETCVTKDPVVVLRKAVSAGT